MNKLGAQIIKRYAIFSIALYLIQVVGFTSIKLYFNEDGISWFVIILGSAVLPAFCFALVYFAWSTVDKKQY